MCIPDVYERNFDDYLERIRQYILQYRVLKFAIAYDEGNRVRNFDKVVLLSLMVRRILQKQPTGTSMNTWFITSADWRENMVWWFKPYGTWQHG